MRIGVISDTHDEVLRTKKAIDSLRENGVEALFHCGDLIGSEIVKVCSVLPFYFTFGNHDSDMVDILKTAAAECGATCLEWGGEAVLSGKRIAVTHGHLTMDLRPLLESKPDYLLSGHSHVPRDWYEGTTHRVNPGALHRASSYTAAIIDLEESDVQFIDIPK